MRNALVGALALAATMAPAAAASAATIDKNHDGIPDRWERAYHLSLKVDQSKRDQDHDGLRNLAEWRDHTNPRNADTDSDGVNDAHDAAPTQAPADDTSQHPAGDSAPPAPGAPGDGDAATGHVVSYQESAGFGGVLTIERPSGERVTAYFGEKTDLECGDAPCTKDQLVAGAPVVAAEHGPNDRGYDVWTKVVLARADGSVTPPPPPAPGDGDAATGHVVSYQQSAGFGGVLTIERPSGERVTAYFGEKTDLECGDAPCTKDQFVAGAPVVAAEHGLNDHGYDVWTLVRLAGPGSAG